MRRIAFVLLVCLGQSLALQAGSAAINKVLPHYLDLHGRHSLSPSLYERDAYQAYLRKHPEEIATMRFDINWKAKGDRHEPLILRLELRTSGSDLADGIVLERPVRPTHFFSAWSSLRLDPEQYTALGRLGAWRASLWRGNQMVAEQKSFLW